LIHCETSSQPSSLTYPSFHLFTLFFPFWWLRLGRIYPFSKFHVSVTVSFTGCTRLCNGNSAPSDQHLLLSPSPPALCPHPCPLCFHELGSFKSACERHPAAFVLLCLAYFTQDHLLQVHPPCREWVGCLPFKGCILLHGVHSPCVSFPPIDGHLGCFHDLEFPRFASCFYFWPSP